MLKTKTLIKLAGGTPGAYGSLGLVAALFDPPISRQAVKGWGENVPAGREAMVKLNHPHLFAKKGKPLAEK